MPTVVAVVALLGLLIWGGTAAFLTAALLMVLEVTLSFDNAVVNAKVLARLSPVWQKRFLTYGIFVAVFLTRALLPILIVAASVALSPLVVTKIAFFDPAHYAELLEGAHFIIAAFGGIFLTLVGLKYFFDEHKELHWIRVIEKHLSRWGSIEAIEIALTLGILVVAAALAPLHATSILFAGIVGIIVFIIVQGAAGSFAVESVGGGLALFIYLNVLDAAFSLDSVVGAFALSTQLPIIIAGLGIGAYFVRTLTVYMVQNGTLDTLAYLEHGAHWAILGLAAAMIGSIFVHVPEPITGLVGLSFVSLAFWSSKRLGAQA